MTKAIEVSRQSTPWGNYVAVFDDYDGAPDSNCPLGAGKTEEDAVDNLLDGISVTKCSETFQAEWREWLRDDHHPLHEDDDHDLLWEQFCIEVARGFKVIAPASGSGKVG